MNINGLEIVVFDVETTGLSPIDGDRIVEIAAMKVRGLEVVDQFYSLVNPKRFLPAAAMSVNGITEDMIADAPFSEDVLPKFVDFVGGACVAGHNVRFDLNFVCYELSLHNRKLKEQTPAIDTLKMAKELFPYLSTYKLAYLARALGISVNQTHRALADVEITVKVLLRLIEKAQTQDLGQIQKFFAQFSVEKPVFKTASVAQSSLF